MLRSFCAVTALIFLVKLRQIQVDHIDSSSSSSNRENVIVATTAPPTSDRKMLGLNSQFCDEDQEHVKQVIKLDLSKPRETLIQDLYQLIIKPVQTNCKNMRRIGE